MLGVYLPTVQHILGVTMFIRLSWCVGVAGLNQTLLMLLLCSLCVSSISLFILSNYSLLFRHFWLVLVSQQWQLTVLSKVVVLILWCQEILDLNLEVLLAFSFILLIPWQQLCTLWEVWKLCSYVFLPLLILLLSPFLAIYFSMAYHWWCWRPNWHTFIWNDNV